jgi:probable rRNA maturation factor
VHGWLHLAGYDDRAHREKRKMRLAETRALKLLRAAGCRPRFRLKKEPRMKANQREYRNRQAR